MSFKIKAVTVAAVLGMSLAMGPAQAAKGAGDCQANLFKIQVKITKAIFAIAGKYCKKAPDAALAAKLGPKLEKKANKLGERYNNKYDKLGCDAVKDPDGTVAKLPLPVAAPGAGETVLLGLDPLCNGVDDP